jgi:nicotinamide-nucleotide amidase
LGERITAIPGSSDVFWGGVISYDNAVKTDILGVDGGLLARDGAVSTTVAGAMAAGVRARLKTEVGVAITGIAGPGGGTADKPVGTVCLAVDGVGDQRTVRTQLIGDRDEIRRRAAQAALNMVRRALM